MSNFDFREVANKLGAGSKNPNDIIAARNKAIEQEFPKAISKLGWHLLKRGDSFDPSQSPHVIVIGVATWSDPDLQGLELLAKQLQGKSIDVYVFDIDECLTFEQLLSLVPGISPAKQTPVVAEYRDGRLLKNFEGPEALAWMQSIKL
jgi:hypothetical protein